MTILISAKWDRRFKRMAEFMSTWSQDPERRVGAVLVDADHRILGLGYNGLPHGVTDLASRLHDQKIRSLMTVHAEVNAVLNSQPSVTARATLYSTVFPCANCAGVIIQAGITRVVCPAPEMSSGWKASWEAAVDMFSEAGVVVGPPLQ